MRADLARRAQALRRQLGRLEVLADELRKGHQPQSLDDEVDPPSEELDLLSTIDRLTRDHLIPALYGLERAARKGRSRGKASPR